MNDFIQQAADVLEHIGETVPYLWPETVVKALADAGLLVTAEQRAVLDAAAKWRDRYPLWDGPLNAAVDALRAATPKDDE